MTEVSVLAHVAYGILEIRDIEADAFDDEVMLAANETVVASSGYQLYLRCLTDTVRVTIRVRHEPPPEGLPLELESGRLLVISPTMAPALEWDVPGGPGVFAVRVEHGGGEFVVDLHRMPESADGDLRAG